jgi:hypothetical protein
MKRLFITPVLLLLIGLAQLPAAVIYTPTTFNKTVGTGDLGVGGAIFTADLPGVNDLVVNSFSYPLSGPASNFYQLYCLNNGGYIAADIEEGLYYAHSLVFGETWVNTSNRWNLGANISRMAQTGNDSHDLRPGPTYLPFYFTDSTDSSTKYGYIALATTLTGSGASAQLNLNISGYAYEDSGAKIEMGAVPEPSGLFSAALGILGIVAVLRWRTRKESC